MANLQVYTGLQIKNEWLGTLGDAYTPTATMTINLDKVLFTSYAELLLIYGPSASLGTAFNMLWRYFAQARMALLTDGPGSARAENAEAAFREFEKLTTTEKNADRFLDSSKAIFPPWMGLLSVQVGDIVVPTAAVDQQPLATAYQVSAISTGVTGASEPSWAAPYQGTGTGPAGGFVAGGVWNTFQFYVNVISGVTYYLWYDLPNTRWVVSTSVPGATPSGIYWTSAAITGTYSLTGTALTLTLAAGSATISDGGATWTAITFP